MQRHGDIYNRFKQYLKAPEGFRFELINESHTDWIIKWRNDPSINQYFYDRSEYTREGQRRFLEDYEKGDRLDLVLVSIEHGKPVGVFSIKDLSTRPESGRLIGEKEFRGLGLAKESVICISEFAFKYLGIKEIYGETQKRNVRNVRRNESIGYRKVGERVVDGQAYYIMKLTPRTFVVHKRLMMRKKGAVKGWREGHRRYIARLYGSGIICKS